MEEFIQIAVGNKERILTYKVLISEFHELNDVNLRQLYGQMVFDLIMQFYKNERDSSS